jgi:hypothetical protein
MRKRGVPIVISAFLTLSCALVSGLARGQETTTLSSSLSDQSSSTSGLDTSYAEGVGALGVTSHVDVTDETHSDVLASSMSPSVEAKSASNYVNADSNSYAPQQNALQLATPDGGTSGTPRDTSFSNSSFNGVGLLESDGFGKGAGDAAFRPTQANSLSTGGADRATGASLTQTDRTEKSGSGDPGADVDPVLLPIGADAILGPSTTSGSSTESTADPTSEAAGFFMTSATEPVAHQFDDGVTPLLRSPLEPGGHLLPLAFEYSAPENGFPDSTLGLAGLPLDTSEIHAPGGLKITSDFGSADSSSGLSFEMKTEFAPNLYAVTPIRAIAHFRATQDRIFEQNILNGMNVTQAELARRKALATYSKNGHGVSKSRRDLLNQPDQGNSQSLLPDTPAGVTIR